MNNTEELDMFIRALNVKEGEDKEFAQQVKNNIEIVSKNVQRLGLKKSKFSMMAKLLEANNILNRMAFNHPEYFTEEYAAIIDKLNTSILIYREILKKELNHE